jgi:hypothetical protein
VAAKRTVRDPLSRRVYDDLKRPGGPPNDDYPMPPRQPMPGRVAPTGSPVGPEQPRRVPRGTGTDSPLR